MRAQEVLREIGQNGSQIPGRTSESDIVRYWTHANLLRYEGHRKLPREIRSVRRGAGLYGTRAPKYAQVKERLVKCGPISPRVREKW